MRETKYKCLGCGSFFPTWQDARFCNCRPGVEPVEKDSCKYHPKHMIDGNSVTGFYCRACGEYLERKVRDESDRSTEI